MIVPFKQKFPNGELTHFVDKIWASFFVYLKWAYRPELAKEWGFNPINVFAQNSKPHTFRDGKRKYKKGDKIHFYTGNRFKKGSYKQFAPVVEVKSVQNIDILWYESEYPAILIDNKPIVDFEELEYLAINDGFLDYEHFLSWFKEDFQGQIIHWTDLRY